MTGKNARQNALVRLVSANAAVLGSDFLYPLLPTQDMVIGRDPSCEIILDAMMYRMVSRRHAIFRPLSTSPDGIINWVLYDLNSANGTYLNGQRLQGSQELQSGDRIRLGHDGPEFLFEYEENASATAIKQLSNPTPLQSATSNPNANSHLSSGDSVSFTQLFPILSTGKDLTTKAYLIPGIITVVFVVLMFATLDNPQLNQVLVATFIAFSAYYFFIYLLCGKHKPWWVLVGSGLATMLILFSPILDLFIFIFRDILPGDLPANQDTITFRELLVRMFFGAGLMEELLKALPIMGAFLIGKILPSPWRERVGVWEPLDGILLGTASAVGFTLLETLGQYVPAITQNVAQQAGEGAGLLAGFQLLIPRILGSLPGHMAYSGYLGYFVGLAVLKPRRTWQILLVGYLTASSLHALWNAAGIINGLLLIIVGVIAYAFLMAAILKARALSPTRSQNFATRFFQSK
ncbi:PrsW family glutamic-type intramembrane protease [Calothrix rhizosoleniae]|uniref:PrsW family glutamic-type intramembrane protease n=1 Tax=Calothrix rhizosoleniae TaxID=888997 RepID=UPI000B4A0E3E|nr:PrsW family glutamic-type intramembrane protease [Calothrix rhizosoleniae]